MFNIGDKIVYPMHGAGTIDAIEEKNILGEKHNYYIIKMPGEVKVMVPTDKAEEVGVRNIINKEEAAKVMSVLGQNETEMSQNWNKRYRDNMDKMKSGDVYEVADVVRNLSFKQKEKGLSTGEKKMLNNAKQILVSELVLAEHASQEEVEKLVENKINISFDEYKLPQENIDIKYRHILASTGITDYTYACYNMVRPGIIMYGHTSRGKEQTKLDLKPCTKLLSKVAYIKNVPENTSISYGRTYITKGYTKIATVPMGYADGVRRELSNKGYVCINGIKAPIIGVVCMDNFMVDVSKVPNVKVGDDVAIWDNENITLEEVASKCDTIVHDILCGITNRVERVYTNY